MGRRHDLRAPRRRHQRDHRSAAPPQDKISFVLVHHEEAAAFMACAHAKTTGKLGVCIATSGPGGVHLLNGLYDAKLDHQPVLAITGMQETQLLGTGYQQEVHLEKLYMDVAEYDVMVTNPVAGHRRSSISPCGTRSRVARVATSPSRTTCRSRPPTRIRTATSRRAGPPETAPVYFAAPGQPRDADLRQARRGAERGQRKIGILAGAGALHARAELLAVAARLAGPIVKTLPGKAAVPDDSSVHDRRHRLARHAAERGRDGGDATRCSWSARTSRTRSTCRRATRCAWCRSRPTRSGPATACRPRCR